jgi:succinylglutamate desuccinylase
LSVFVGNVEAARIGVRRMEGQPDFNRVWPGAPDDGSAEYRMMKDVVNIMARRNVFSSIDLHNNTGLNPHYACINRLEHRFLHLALLFSRIVVYFTQPEGVQSEAFAALCPSVTVECGKPGVVSGMKHAAEFVEAALHLSEFPANAVQQQDVDLFHTVATVKVPEHMPFAVGGQGAGLSFINDIDHLNFRELPPGTLLGKYLLDSEIPLTVASIDHIDVADRYFEIRQGQLLTRRPLMPAMLTRDERIIRQDCLCYLMERIDYNRVRL